MFFEEKFARIGKKNPAQCGEKILKFLVSAGGLEPPTLCLKGRCSTPELRAHKILEF